MHGGLSQHSFFIALLANDCMFNFELVKYYRVLYIAKAVVCKYFKKLQQANKELLFVQEDFEK